MYSKSRVIALSNGGKGFDDMYSHLDTISFSFCECLRCNVLQPRDCTIISRMEPKQVTISKPSQRTRRDDVDHRLYVATLAPIRRGHVPFV